MDALLVVFLSGLISLFAAFAKKPVIVISTAIGGLLLALSLLICQFQSGHSYVDFGSYKGLEFDNVALLFSMAIVLFTALILAAGYEKFKQNPEHTGEYIGLLMFSATGAMIMTGFTDMFMFFLGLEILSIPIYVMVGSSKRDIRSTEASLKYFLTGSFATGLLLFGIAWVYGATGSFSLQEISMKISEMGEPSSILMIGILLILASFLFKIGAAPFHFWSPDVYDGAPYAVMGYMAGVVKVSALFAFLKMFAFAFGSTVLYDFWSPVIAGLLILTLFVGNLSAIRQVKLKRLLAYSSITHAGYTLLIFFGNGQIFESLWLYMAAYGFSIVGIIVVGINMDDEEDLISNLKGLAQRNKLLAVVAVISMLSLAGIPPTAGFFGKYALLTGAWSKASWLVIIALVNSGIGIMYYLRVMGTVVSKSDEPKPAIKLSFLTTLVVILSILGTLCLGFLIPAFQ